MISTDFDSGISARAPHGNVVNPMLIDHPRLAAQLNERARHWRIEVVAETGSTNADLTAQLREKQTLAAPLVRAAYAQTAGRGRRGRKWLAAPGDALQFSVGCLVPRPLDQISGLSLAASVAVVAGLRALPLSGESPSGSLTRPQIALKWPNDVLLNEAKLAGILVETGWSNVRMSAVVIGVGVNLRGSRALAMQIGATETLNGKTRPTPPTAIDQIWPAVEITATFAQLLNALANMLDQFGAAGFAPFQERWNADHAYTGRTVSLIEQGTEVLRGVAGGVDERGQLLIDCGAAGVRAVTTGDLSLRPTECSPASAFGYPRSCPQIAAGGHQAGKDGAQEPERL